ncbi:wall-associated receptor kinase 2 [Citrus clementina]|uniref:wall-associated receptor kinase 2 n=1 Tax=Citrus clementina TaxID=85681 RepID=UPI000CED2CA6|nr:wall-associated receptor kinase 2 [Citrus x clementina]
MGFLKMPFRLIVLVVLVQLLLLAMSCHCCTSRASTASAAHAQAKPGCLNRCGDVEIPYPFGTEPGCFLNEDFRITCKDTHFNPPKPFLGESNVEIVNISIDGHLNVMQFTAKDCYGAKGNSVDSNWPTLNLSKLSVSKGNKFVVIGCDSFAFVSSGFLGEDSYESGCRSTCNSLDYVTNGSCVGIGCCQIEIPSGLKQLDVEAYSFNNHTNVSSFNPCTYAFVVDQSEFHFTSNYLALGGMPDEFPIVLDWEITTNETCEEAKICGPNASCDKSKDDTTTSSGYHCKCNKGYEGNPYLPDGCQDVNECNDPKLHDCKEICVNTEGSYTCHCPKGFHGDGRKYGGGCTPNQHTVIKVTLGVGISFVVAVMSISWLHFLWKRRKHMKLKEKFFEQNGGSSLQQELSKLQGRSSEKAKIFTEEEIKTVTNNYANVIGRGGSGLVYKGFLPNKTPVAVKKSKIVDQTKIDEFINELVVVSQINRRNVVRLLGCCLETQVPLLVYEFVGNGNLFEQIHKNGNLSWERRLRIAAETAGVLSYLHSETNVPIIHRDVKSANILLDENYTPKVSDFGASKLVPIDAIQNYTVVQGTLGYVDPEYLQTCKLTDKSDVYSFGVVLAELLTGKMALLSDKPEEERSLAMNFLSSLKQNRLLEILDNRIVNDGNKQQLKEVAKLAARCISVRGEERPTMKEVAFELQGRLSLMSNGQYYLRDNVESNGAQETEYFTATFYECRDGIGSHTTPTDGYDSMQQPELMAFDDER